MEMHSRDGQTHNRIVPQCRGHQVTALPLLQGLAGEPYAAIAEELRR